MAKTKEKKEKKDKSATATVDGEAVEIDSYDEKSKTVCAIATPLAPKKLNKKILKTIKKASKAKHVKRGVKEVVKALRKKEQGLVIIAGDISPIDVISHLPVLCEDNNVPYIYTPSKEELGGAGGTKRPTSVVMVQLGGRKKDDAAAGEYKEAYEEICKEISTTAIMPLIRPSHFSAARAARFTPSTLQIRRPLSSSQAFRSAEGSHEEHYDAPGGWLFGVKPGEKYQNEGWENVFIYGFFGTLAFGVIGYCYKPDTSIQTWALEEARRRLEAEGILQDPGLRQGNAHANTTE